MGNKRIEKDSLGSVEVDEERLYGAQTARSKLHFWAGSEKMPQQLLESLVLIKKEAAAVNEELGLLDSRLSKAIEQSAQGLLQNWLSEEFPLVIWQTGSGTQSNMNVNEVLASLANERLGAKRGDKSPVHPNDHVNMGQSSNDVFPTAMHIASAGYVKQSLLPSLEHMINHWLRLSLEYEGVIKVGRTHLMDAAPLTYGDVFGAYASQLVLAKDQIEQALLQVYELALGATAVGTGLNSHPQMAPKVIERIAKQLLLPFKQASNLFSALSGHEPLLGLSAALRTLACALMKIANDVRWLASGPRCGIGELSLPENEPGSSIMPGKVNPTQCESLTMIAAQVMGCDSVIAWAAASGQFELNVYKPLIIHNLLRSASLLKEGMDQFSHYALQDLKVNTKRTQEHLDRCLMLATVLNQIIGYDQSAKIVRLAYTKDLSLKEAALALGFLSAREFEARVKPEKMLKSKR
jgi:fumarate hydratase class II